MQQIYGKNNRSMNIAIQAPSKETYDECVEDLTNAMRIIRKDKPVLITVLKYSPTNL
ncbi:MAG: hypothetical protein R2942_04055 [Ignavibacteria bacterium]